MISDARAEPSRRAEDRGRVPDAPSPPVHAPHRFWVISIGVLVASALAWVALVLWGGGRDMRRGLLTGGNTLTSMDGTGADAARASMGVNTPAMDMPGMDMSGGGDMSMLGVSMTGKDPASLGYFGLFLWMWTVMILAMMLPVVVPSVRAFLAHDETGARSAGLRFVTAVTAIWVAVGVALYGVLVVLNALLPDPNRLAVDVGAGCVLLAGLFQFSRTKERSLAHVRGPFCRGTGPWLKGFDHGRRCIISCGPYMVAVALIGMMNLAWMALFAIVMVAEQVAELVAGKGMLVARGIGVVVVLIALSLLLAPGPLPLLA